MLLLLLLIILASVSQSSLLTVPGASGGMGAAATTPGGVEKYRFIRKRLVFLVDCVLRLCREVSLHSETWVFLVDCVLRLCILVKAGTTAPLCGCDRGLSLPSLLLLVRVYG